MSDYKLSGEIAYSFFSQLKRNDDQCLYVGTITKKQCDWLKGQFLRENPNFRTSHERYGSTVIDGDGREIGTWDLLVLRYGAGGLTIRLYDEVKAKQEKEEKRRQDALKMTRILRQYGNSPEIDKMNSEEFNVWLAQKMMEE